MLRRLKKGQSTAEYAIVIGLVIAAAVAMQVYVKRSIQGKMKDATDYNDEASTMLTTTQYEPYYSTTTDMTTTQETSEVSQTLEGGGVIRTIQGENVSTQTGTRNILAVEP